MESLNRKLLVVNEVHHHRHSVDSERRKGAASQQYEMMCGAYKRERDGKCYNMHEQTHSIQSK